MPVDEGSTLTRADLADALHRTVGFSRNDALHLVEQILARMTDALAAGENVKITNFGTFLLNDKAERVGRNPKTGVEVPVSARRVVTFRPSQGLRDQVAGSPAT
jgi:integration host factor subunit alpha